MGSSTRLARSPARERPAERKRAQGRITACASYVGNAIKNLPAWNRSAVILCDSSDPGHIIACNDKWNTLCGYSPEDCMGSTPKLLQGSATDSNKAQHYTQSCLQLRYGENATTKLLNYKKDGSTFVHCLCTYRVQDEHGRGFFLTESTEEQDPKVSCHAITRQISTASHCSPISCASQIRAAVLCRSRQLEAQPPRQLGGIEGAIYLVFCFLLFLPQTYIVMTAFFSTLPYLQITVDA